MIASFSRALTEGLSVQQSDEDFDAALNDSIASIFAASITWNAPRLAVSDRTCSDRDTSVC